MQNALIFGVNGQDGSYLSELLLSKGYNVYGVKRRTSTNNLYRLNKLNILNHPNFKLIDGDISDTHSVYNIFKQIRWHENDFCEVYNLAAQSFVQASFVQPSYTFDVNLNGCLNCLEIISSDYPWIRYYFAATSEMFGNSCDDDGFQRESTPFFPASPYAISKLAAYHLVKNYREGYNLHASSGILFNHESPLRGEEFVTRKITKYVAALSHYRDTIYNLEDAVDGKHFPKLKLGNINSYRDFGYSKEYVYGMWLMLQQDEPDDYILATGKATQIVEFLARAFRCINIKDWKNYVEIDEDLFRPNELHYLQGDSTKAKEKLGWTSKTNVDELAKIMVEADINEQRLQRPSLYQMA